MYPHQVELIKAAHGKYPGPVDVRIAEFFLNFTRYLGSPFKAWIYARCFGASKRVAFKVAIRCLLKWRLK